jgi:hypothetical protein
MRDITLAETIYIFFTTRAFATGIPTVLAGSPVVSAYENDSVTQITAGITLGVSHDSVAGLNLLTIVATGANGYEAAKDYTLVITTGTVDSVSVVGEVVGEFTIGRSAAATDLANGTDGLGALKAETDALPTLAEIIAGLADEVRYATAQGGSATTITLDAAANANNDYYNGTLVMIVGGTGATTPPQVRAITDYVGSTKLATVATWGTNPDATSTFLILGLN